MSQKDEINPGNIESNATAEAAKSKLAVENDELKD